MRGWKNFWLAPGESFDLPEEGIESAAREFPSCGASTLRWYRCEGNFRRETAYIYVWCSTCRHYYGQTYWEPAWALPDPLDHLTGEDREYVEADLDRFFGRLDALWADGSLPQVKGRETGV